MLTLGVFDQDVSEEYSIKFPQLYCPGLHATLFNKKEFFKSAVQGFIASCVLFFTAHGEMLFIFSEKACMSKALFFTLQNIFSICFLIPFF